MAHFRPCVAQGIKGNSVNCQFYEIISFAGDGAFSPLLCIFVYIIIITNTDFYRGVFGRQRCFPQSELLMNLYLNTNSMWRALSFCDGNTDEGSYYMKIQKYIKIAVSFFSARLKIWRDLAPADKKMWSRLGENLNEKNLNE